MNFTDVSLMVHEIRSELPNIFNFFHTLIFFAALSRAALATPVATAAQAMRGATRRELAREEALTLAEVVELMHVSTLIHDTVRA